MILRTFDKNKERNSLGGYCCISTVPDPSGSGRVDMLTSPVAAARAAVATGAWVKSKHDVYLIRGSVGALSFIITHPLED